MDVRHLDLTLDPACVKDVKLLKEVFDAIRPNWDIANVQVTNLSNVGFVNTNMICRHGDDDDALFIRVTQSHMHKFFRKHLKINRKLVHEQGLSVELLCTFENGFVEKCLEGEGITWPTKNRLHEPRVLSGVAREMARYHTPEVYEAAEKAGVQFDNNLLNTEWLQYIWDNILKDERISKSELEALPSYEYLQQERRKMNELCEQLGARKAFCHQDICPVIRNVFLLDNGAVMFTDYETTCLSYDAMEIGYFFYMLNFTMGENPNERYPEPDLRRQFCRQYLEACHQLAGENRAVTERELNEFEQVVSIGKLAAELLFLSYLYGFLTETIFNTLADPQKLLPALHDLWSQYEAEKEETLSSLSISSN